METINSFSKISVIIPTKNEENALQECLESIFNQSIRPLEVIIVDGGSTDKTLDIAKKFNTKILKEDSFLSPANARNLGINVAKGDILLIMDADIQLHKDCLKYALEKFEDKDVMIVLPTEMNITHSYLEHLQQKWNEGTRSYLSIGLKRAKTSGFVAFFRMQVFEKIKFSTKYGFGEDDDLITRIEKEFKGYKTVVVQECKVISHSPHGFREFITRYMWWGRTFLYYFFDHFNIRSILNISSLLLPFFVAFAFFLWWLLIPKIFVIFMILLSLFVIKVLIVCIRSRSTMFVQFMLFDLMRSLCFVAGLLTSPFSIKKSKGR
ncbi:MAG: glycosyltransferase family 2 protein [Candidatus Bathyarchaeia archaeon]